MCEKKIALVTVFNPDQHMVDNIIQISQQVDWIGIADNSKIDNSELFAGILNCRYQANQKNLGLSRAFNLFLQDIKYVWNENDIIIFFDQDSWIEQDYIQQLIKTYKYVEKNFPMLGCMGPIFYNASNDTLERPKIKTKIMENNYRVDNVITSSMITRYRNLHAINFWNEELFLDFADWDLCWRMQQKGMITVITTAVVLHHVVGCGGKKVGIFRLRIGQPLREYYETRDAYYLLEKQYVPLKMRLRLLGNVIIRPMVHYLFLDNRKERYLYVKQGRKDYKKRIHGQYVRK